MLEDASAASGESPEEQGGESPQPDAAKAKEKAGESPEKSKLEEARQEAAEERRKRQAAEAKVQKFETANLSEKERLEKAAADEKRRGDLAEEDLRQERLSRAIERQASKLGFIDAEDAVLVIDRAAIKVDDVGRPDPESLEKALTKLAAAKPHLVGARNTGSGDGGARRSSPAGTDMNSLFREKAGLGPA